MTRRGWMARLSRCLLLWLWAPMVLAQTFEFAPPPTVEDAATPAAMRDLAVRLLPVYQDPDIQRYLATLSMLQLVAGNDQRPPTRASRCNNGAGTSMPAMILAPDAGSISTPVPDQSPSVNSGLTPMRWRKRFATPQRRSAISRPISSACRCGPPQHRCATPYSARSNTLAASATR